MRISTVAALVFAVVAGGCATTPATIVTLGPFDRAQAAAMLEPGTNTIRGSALIRQQGGGVVTCAGRDIALVPATQYAQQRITALYGQAQQGYYPAWPARGVKFANEAPEYQQLTRATVCDAQGFFKFERVADGDFFVVTAVTWQARQYVVEGGALMQRVRVAGGEMREIVLTAR